ncbi:hypothetical protein Acr_19g0000950 [Actinidia rufa]|uniref:Uncharacterized protein n=1 Tax=Actinidia rufa TaxID=165716 RepID=A0A7J0G8X6_9ERIC|nr:hypothetical protein Acr_19g0000950 [Actinidia rufa]
MNNKRGRDVLDSKNKKSETNKSQKSAIPSSGERKLYAADNLKVKSSAMGTKKRGLESVEECRKEKIRKMDPSATQQCYKELDDLFDTRWRSLEAKWNRGCTIVEPRCMPRGSAKNTRTLSLNGDRASSVRVGLLPKTLTSAKESQKFWNWGRTNVGQRRTSAEEMQKLREQILEVSRGKISQQLQGLLKKLGFNCVREENIEVDIDAFAEETLTELKGIIGSFIGARAAKTTYGVQQSERKMNHKRGADSGHRSISDSAANINTPLNLVTSKCGSCGSIRCQCSLQRDYAKSSSSGLCSERSLGRAHLDTSRKDYDGKGRSSSQMSKSDLDSDGSASALAQERNCSLNEPASGEDCTLLVDVQLSPKMALRAAKLKSRYAKIILKANTFLAHVAAVQGDKADLVLLEKEKESLKRQQREEKFETEAAQTRAAEASSRTELKKQREQERKAARLALEQMERTVEIDDNLVSLKDLNDMPWGSWSDIDPAVVLGPVGGIHVGSVLQRPGLFFEG